MIQDLRHQLRQLGVLNRDVYGYTKPMHRSFRASLQGPPNIKTFWIGSVIPDNAKSATNTVSKIFPQSHCASASVVPDADDGLLEERLYEADLLTLSGTLAKGNATSCSMHSAAYSNFISMCPSKDGYVHGMDGVGIQSVHLNLYICVKRFN